MILPDLILPSRINQRWKYSGIDSFDRCCDREHFKNYSIPIEYVYNSRGFRDKEWPADLTELQEAIWCIGDSFTAGIGQPFAHTWPNILAERINKRTINVSMDGASNDWICRRAMDIANEINPKTIVIMWSFIHRQEDSNYLLDDEHRRLFTTSQSHNEDLHKWLDQTNCVRGISNIVVQSSIPEFIPRQNNQPHDLWQSVKGHSWPSCPQNLSELEKLPQWIKKELKELHSCFDYMKSILEWNDMIANLPADIIYVNERLDWARDHYHFDILTAKWVVDKIENQLKV